MKLLNFHLTDGTHPIEIKALDLIWDLHNVMEFISISHDIKLNTVEMQWKVDQTYALQKYPSEGFSILFKDVHYFAIRQRDESLPHSDDGCLASISRIHCTETWEVIEEYGGVPPVEDIKGEDFHLLFDFQSGQKIRIGSETAEFKLTNSFSCLTSSPKRYL